MYFSFNKCISLQMSTLAEVRQREMEMLLSLRTSNESRFFPVESCSTISVCVCQKAPSGAMVQCELCREVFHGGCVEATDHHEYSQAWLCPLCQRSSKPPLDKVLPLLASLQRIRVRLPEGDALRFLIERTVRWQHRVQQACTDGVLEKLSKMVSVSYLCVKIEGCDATQHEAKLIILLLQAKAGPRILSHLTQETKGSSFHVEHPSLPLDGQCLCF